jgi:hypothetical protein
MAVEVIEQEISERGKATCRALLEKYKHLIPKSASLSPVVRDALEFVKKEASEEND